MTATATVPYQRARPEGMIQEPVSRERVTPARRIESWLIFVLFGAAYGVLGYWLIVEMRVVSFTSLARLTGAYLSWHNDPAKLAAIGFNAPPLQTIVLLPFAIVSSLATSLVALCVCSGLFGGMTMVVINRVLTRCSLPAPLRYPVLLLVGLAPTTAYYAADGGPEIIGIMLGAAAMSGLLAWYITVNTRYLIGSGLLFALAGMADYGMFVWGALAAAMVTSTLIRHHASDREVEGSLLTYMAPTAYALAIWVLFNVLIVHSPLGWATGAATDSVNGATIGTVPLTVGQAAWGSIQLALASAPLLLLVIPLLFLSAVAQRNELTAWFTAFGVVTLLTPGAEALIYHNAAQLQLSKGLPMMVIAVFGAASLYRSLPRLRPLVALVLLLALGGSVYLVWTNMATYRYQDMERSFHQAIKTRTSQEGTRLPGGELVGIDQELAMANYIDQHVHRAKSILTDNSQTYAVILLSGRPSLFRTRIDHGDGAWVKQVIHPPTAVKYMLIAQDDPGDFIHQTYPEAMRDDPVGLTLVYADQRYALFTVAPGLTAVAQTSGSAGGLISVTAADSSLPSLQPSGS